MSIREIFRKNKRCFIPFVTAGHPTLEATHDIIIELVKAGAQIVEIGIPFSDPIADGPVNQRSSFQALQHGYTMDDYLALVKKIREKSDVGLLFMTYVNPVLNYGLPALDRDGAAAGLDGILILDLTPEEFEILKPDEMRLETVFLVAPTSTEERIARACSASTGFIYLIARTGVTGAKTEVGTALSEQVEQVRRHTDLPVAVGFGIRSAKDIRRVWESADGAIVGSAIVKFIDENKDAPDLASRVGKFVKETLLS